MLLTSELQICEWNGLQRNNSLSRKVDCKQNHFLLHTKLQIIIHHLPIKCSISYPLNALSATYIGIHHLPIK